MLDEYVQQINKKRRLLFLTEEYSDELVPKMGWKHIPYELIYEILSFHTRNEIEKFQLVSKTWNQIVIYNLNYLPLRLLKKMFFSFDKEKLSQILRVDIDWYPGYSIPIEGHMENSLKSCIIGSFDLPLVEWRNHLPISDLISPLEKLIKNIDQRIRISEMSISNNYKYNYEEDEEDNDEEDEEDNDEEDILEGNRLFLKNMKTIFVDLLDVKSLFIELADSILKEILINPKIFEIIETRNMPEKIRFILRNSFDDPFVLTLHDVDNFIQKSKFKGRFYELTVRKQEKDFGKNYFKMFMKSKNPSDLIRSIQTGLKKLIWIIIVLLIVLIAISVYSILKDSHKEEYSATNNVPGSRVPNNTHKCPGSEMICKNDEACTPVYNDQSETGPFLFLNDHFCRPCYRSYKNCAQSVTECCGDERCIWYERSKYTCK
uniref:F-box domain-containing protein n=1 Tax=Acrobeloides nanus TaxID=290746 RepID=A0A914DIG8_9BILA